MSHFVFTKLAGKWKQRCSCSLVGNMPLQLDLEGHQRVSKATYPLWSGNIRTERAKINSSSNSSVFSRESRLILPSCAEQSLDMSAHVNPVNILTQLLIYLCVTFLHFNRRRGIHTLAHVHASTCTDTVTGGDCILQYVCAACAHFSVCVCL